MDTKTDRIKYIDLFRGIGIIIMVLGHMKFAYKEGEIGNRIFDTFDIIIHSFHMPMFFFLSGFCYKSSELSIYKQMIKKAKSLLIPYFFYGILQFLLWRIFEGGSFNPLLHLFWVNTEGLAIAGALWFLTALFIVNVIYIVFDRYIRNKSLLIILVSIIGIIGCFSPKLLGIRLPYAIDSAFVGLGFFGLGSVLSMQKNSGIGKIILNLNLGVLLPIICLNILLTVNNPMINMRTARYDKVYIFWTISIVAIIVGINLCRIVSEIVKENNSMGKLIEYVADIGKNGIIYVCINQLIITILNRLLINDLKLSWVYNIVMVIATFIILRVAVLVINKTWLRMTIGKRKEK